jgi:hypothetical protein
MKTLRRTAAGRGNCVMSTGENKKDMLSEKHRRAITSTLLLLDRTLCEIEEYARGREIRSVLYVEHNTLSVAQRRELLAEIERIRGLLRELKDRLGLEARITEVDHKIWGRCSSFWEVLAETKSRSLRRYGSPPDGLAEYLDPRIDGLIVSLRNLTKSVGINQR